MPVVGVGVNEGRFIVMFVRDMKNEPPQEYVDNEALPILFIQACSPRACTTTSTTTTNGVTTPKNLISKL